MKIKRLLPFVAIVLLVVACQSAPTLKSEAPKVATSVALSPGELIMEVGARSDLPKDLKWYPVPAQWEYRVASDTVIATVTWEDANTVNVNASNHSTDPEFQESSSVKGAWAVTDSVTAQKWLENKVTQYAMLGFKDEIKIFFIFDGEGTDSLKVAFLPAQNN